MGLREVKKELSNLPKEELLKHIGELYNKFKPVKEYFNFYINCDEEKIIQQYKKELTHIFRPVISNNPDVRKAKSVLSKIKKLGVSEKTLIELYLHYIDCILIYGDTFGHWDDNLYYSADSVWEKANDLITKNKLESIFKNKIDKLYSFGSDYGFFQY